MRKQTLVYLLTYPDGSSFYVGKGSRERMKQTLRDKGNLHKRRVIDEIRGYGFDVRVEIVGVFDNDADAVAKEMFEIVRIGRFPNGPLMNMNDGGPGQRGYKYSEEDRVNMSFSKRGRIRPRDIRP